ncbi:hypothetical protein [Microbacterium sp.]|uniref:hypothetical protein n=1 Tax=Microbacterium sp. TaxID=51671 RepID=UPI003C771D00
MDSVVWFATAAIAWAVSAFLLATLTGRAIGLRDRDGVSSVDEVSADALAAPPSEAPQPPLSIVTGVAGTVGAGHASLRP